MYKYFTWKKSNYFEGNNLITKQQINILINNVVDNYTEAYSTVQDYDLGGSILGCNMYFDIDSSNILDAYHAMIDIRDNIICDYEVEPYIWFSGSKGFHIILPLYIKHGRCHEIAKIIASSFKCDLVDMKVYRTRSMLRMHNTINNKTGLYKIPVIIGDKLESIISNARERFIHKIKYKSGLVSPEFNDQINAASRNLPDINNIKKVVSNVDFYSDMMPCLKKLWSMDNPPKGDRHQLCHIMARHCLISGLSQVDAIKIFSSHLFWSNVNSRDYEKVISSVFKNSKAYIGCKSGNDGDLLRQHCYDRCIFSDNFNRETRFGWTQEECERENNRKRNT